MNSAHRLHNKRNERFRNITLEIPATCSQCFLAHVFHSFGSVVLIFFLVFLGFFFFVFFSFLFMRVNNTLNAHLPGTDRGMDSVMVTNLV
jgi:hypothetical protein